MDKKVIKPSIMNVDKAIEYYAHFGWEEVDRKEEKDCFVISLERDNKIPNYRYLVEMEKECTKITKPAPWFGILWMILGTLCIVLFFLLKDKYPLMSFFWVGVAIFYSLGIMHIVTFIVIKIHAKKFLQKISEYGDYISGRNTDVPFSLNVAKYEEGKTYLIKDNIKRIVIK